jgi:mono/diheme cytochrome c family protein
VALIGVDVSGCRRAIAACAAFALAIGGIALAQAAEKTIRDQVYSETQAARGKSVYDKQCSSCHDGGMGPSLMGDDFLATWDNKAVRTLYNRVLTTMPSDEPGSVGEPDLLDLMAYLIRANGFPAGSKAFESPNELNTIKIVRSK